MAQWPLALTGSYWLQVSIIVGAIAVAIRMRPPLARVGALFAVLWIVLLAVWTGANLGIMAAFSLSPIYFFLMMYPFWAFFSLYAGVRLIEITTSRFVPKARSADPRLVCAALCVAAVALIPLFHAEVSRVFKWGGVQSRAATPITQALRENIALRPGQTYRGSVATLLGSPGSPLRRQLLVEAEQPLKPYEFERFLQKLAADTGSTHERTGSPSRCTVQAPHCASPQPKCGLLRPRSLRSAYSSGISGSAFTETRLPSTVIRNVAMRLLL
jgi:signal transduction histidine kinase